MLYYDFSCADCVKSIFFYVLFGLFKLFNNLIFRSFLACQMGKYRKSKPIKDKIPKAFIHHTTKKGFTE